MKTIFLASMLALAVLGTSVRGEDTPAPLKLSDGRTLMEWSITRESALHVIVKHKGGMTKVAKKHLPAELLERYPIDEEAGKAEAAALAAAEKAGEQRKAQVEAARAKEYEQRVARDAQRQKAVDAAVEARRTEMAIRQATATETPPAQNMERIRAEVRRRADRYYRAERQTGSGATLVFRTDVELDEPRPISGWAGEYEVNGTCWYQYYDSVWGGSFSRVVAYFTARVDTRSGSPKVTSFAPRLTQPTS